MNAIQELLQSVVGSFERAPDPRSRLLQSALMKHLFAFADEVQLTREEWLAGLQFLNRVGQTSTANRDEFMLLSDVLGVSTLMDCLDQPADATEGTVLGPYYSPDSPLRRNGASVIDTDDGGERLIVSGTVQSSSGEPLAKATVDTWSCASNGLYPAQDPTQAPTNLRGIITTDDEGRYEFTTLRPVNYAVPTDGPVGDLLRFFRRGPMRAAHVHMIIAAPGYRSVVTHLFDDATPYLKEDAVFSVRDTLVRRFEQRGKHTWRAQFDVKLVPLT